MTRRDKTLFSQFGQEREAETCYIIDTTCLDHPRKTLTITLAYNKSHQGLVEYITIFKTEIYDLSDQPAQQSSTRIQPVQHAPVPFEQRPRSRRN